MIGVTRWKRTCRTGLDRTLVHIAFPNARIEGGNQGDRYWFNRRGFDQSGTGFRWKIAAEISLGRLAASCSGSAERECRRCLRIRSSRPNESCADWNFREPQNRLAAFAVSRNSLRELLIARDGAYSMASSEPAKYSARLNFCGVRIGPSMRKCIDGFAASRIDDAPLVLKCVAFAGDFAARIRIAFHKSRDRPS